MVLLRVAFLALLAHQLVAQPVNFSVVYPDVPAPPITSKLSLREELFAWEPILIFRTLLDAHSYILSGKDSLILAPTNAAFLKLFGRVAPQTDNPLAAAASITETLNKLINSPNLTRILAYHVIEKDLMETALGDSQLTASGGMLSFRNFPDIEDADPVSEPRRTYRQIKVTGGSLMFLSDVLLPVPLQSMLPAAGNTDFPDGMPDMSNGVPGDGSVPGSNENGPFPQEQNGTFPAMGNQTLPGSAANESVPNPTSLGPSGGPDIFSTIMGALSQTVFMDPFTTIGQLLGARNDMQIMGTLVTLIPDLSLAVNSAPLHVLAPTDEGFIKLFAILGQNISLPEISISNVSDPGFLANLTKILTIASTAGQIWDSVNGLPGPGQILRYHIIPQATDYDKLLEMSRSAPIPTALQNNSLVFQPDAVIDGDPSRMDPKPIATYPTLNGYVTVLDGVLTPFDTSVAGAVLDGAMGTPTPTPSPPPPSNNEGVCFPADAVVYTKHGVRRMEELMGGDEIRVDETQERHSVIFMFTHKLTTGTHTFVKLHTAAGYNVTLTSSHYVHLKRALVAAGSIRVGDMLRTVGGESAVVKVETVRRRGLVAPHTVDGGLIVDGVRVSGYSQAVHPWVAHALLVPVRWYVKVSGAVEPFGTMFYHGGDGLRRFVPSGGVEYDWA